ncbi:MAG TPA: tripartite tricarboxylate transporter substrate binding protein [Falsiroseomonas sp.]|jgi:tripartite-type tricarboxylate transporter receptor subunit TctC|nr:tripartite tricarboxylate transporter substrate binding protein [Falsiroseomonas sp.]
MASNITRRALTLAAASLLPCTVRAQSPNWPSGPVRLVVGFPPGGGNDLLARIVAEHMSTTFGQPFVVENRPGGSGVIAIDAVKRAAPDGQTLLIGPSSGMTVNPVVLPSVSYDPVRDFAPIGIIGNFPLVVVVNPSNPARSLGELIERAKARPGEVTYASAATSFQMATEVFAAEAGVKLLHVPYRGSAPAVQAVLSNEVALAFGDMAAVLPVVQAGQLRALAISTPQRSSALPEVPTIAEAGVPGYALVLWSAMFAPRDTPSAITGRIHSELARLTGLPAFRERLGKLGVEAVGSTPEVLTSTMRAELEKFRAVAQTAGIRAGN